MSSEVQTNDQSPSFESVPAQQGSAPSYGAASLIATENHPNSYLLESFQDLRHPEDSTSDSDAGKTSNTWETFTINGTTSDSHSDKNPTSLQAKTNAVRPPLGWVPDGQLTPTMNNSGKSATRQGEVSIMLDLVDITTEGIDVQCIGTAREGNACSDTGTWQSAKVSALKFCGFVSIVALLTFFMCITFAAKEVSEIFRGR